MSQVRSSIWFGVRSLILMSLGIGTTVQANITVDSQNDPYPVFSTMDPHTFLQTSEKLYLKGLSDVDKRDNFSFAFSPYGQNACKAKDICGIEVEIGDLQGRWAMIALLFGATPEGQSFPQSLLNARATLFPDIPIDTPIEEDTAIDPSKQCGFFSAPIQYRKRGLRFEAEGRISQNTGIRLQVGFADISQTLCCCGGPGSCGSPCATDAVSCCISDDICAGLINLTNKVSADVEDACAGLTSSNPNLTKANINDSLMRNVCVIAQEICTNIDSFHKTSVEDIRPSLFWRHAYVINEDREGWPQFLITPFATLDGSIAVGKEWNRHDKFGLSFGSSDHNAVGATAGFNVDFPASIEFGCEIGITHFFTRNFCDVPVPTSCYQSGIYPFCTDVRVSPGRNWNFCAKMTAYHFLERLSFYFQYVLVQHDEDKICLKKADPVFKPHLLEKMSSWKVQVANIAFNYDVSPNIAFGFLWQAPLKQNNVYRASSIIWCTLNITL